MCVLCGYKWKTSLDQVYISPINPKGIIHMLSLQILNATSWNKKTYIIYIYIYYASVNISISVSATGSFICHIGITKSRKWKHDFRVEPKDRTPTRNFIQICLEVLKLHHVDRQEDMVNPICIHFIRMVQRTHNNGGIKVSNNIIYTTLQHKLEIYTGLITLVMILDPLQMSTQKKLVLRKISKEQKDSVL